MGKGTLGASGSFARTASIDVSHAGQRLCRCRREDGKACDETRLGRYGDVRVSVEHHPYEGRTRARRSDYEEQGVTYR